jgi:hypothetical protein
MGIMIHYRGEGQLHNGKAVIQELEHLKTRTSVEEPPVHLTSITGADRLAIKLQDGRQIKNGKLIVYSENPHSTQVFKWEIYDGVSI